MIPAVLANQLVLGWRKLQNARRRKADFFLFISHAQSDNGDRCKLISTVLKRELGLTAWYDMEVDDLTTTGMAAGIDDARCFVLCISRQALHRPFVLFELVTAVRLNKPIRFVHMPQTDVEIKRNVQAASTTQLPALSATQLAGVFAVADDNQAQLNMVGLLRDERELKQKGRQLAKLLSLGHARDALARIRSAKRWSDLREGGPSPSAAPEWSMPSAEEEREDLASEATTAIDPHQQRCVELVRCLFELFCGAPLEFDARPESDGRATRLCRVATGTAGGERVFESLRFPDAGRPGFRADLSAFVTNLANTAVPEGSDVLIRRDSARTLSSRGSSTDGGDGSGASQGGTCVCLCSAPAAALQATILQLLLEDADQRIVLWSELVSSDETPQGAASDSASWRAAAKAVEIVQQQPRRPVAMVVLLSDGFLADVGVRGALSYAQNENLPLVAIHEADTRKPEAFSFNWNEDNVATGAASQLSWLDDADGDQQIALIRDAVEEATHRLMDTESVRFERRSYLQASMVQEVISRIHDLTDDSSRQTIGQKAVASVRRRKKSSVSSTNATPVTSDKMPAEIKTQELSAAEAAPLAEASRSGEFEEQRRKAMEHAKSRGKKGAPGRNIERPNATRLSDEETLSA